MPTADYTPPAADSPLGKALAALDNFDVLFKKGTFTLDEFTDALGRITAVERDDVFAAQIEALPRAEYARETERLDRVTTLTKTIGAVTRQNGGPPDEITVQFSDADTVEAALAEVVADAASHGVSGDEPLFAAPGLLGYTYSLPAND